MTKLYRLYCDESGDHTYFNVDEPGKRYLGITGCIVSQEYYASYFQPELERLKKKHFHYDPDDPIIFHREDIVRHKGSFWPLRDEKKRELFNEDLLSYLQEMNFKLIQTS